MAYILAFVGWLLLGALFARLAGYVCASGNGGPR